MTPGGPRPSSKPLSLVLARRVLEQLCGLAAFLDARLCQAEEERAKSHDWQIERTGFAKRRYRHPYFDTPPRRR